MDHISIINALLKKCFSNANVLNDAKLTSDIDNSISDIITKDIPQQLSLMLNNNYIIKGSVGAGRATRTPWISILDKEITTSTREGVYVVFLFASDFRRIYLTFNQGTTVPGQFGPRLSKKEISANSQDIRKMLQYNNSVLKVDNQADIADERYQTGAIYYTLWDTDNEVMCNNLIKLYLDIYQTYKEKTKGYFKTNINSMIIDNQQQLKYRPYITAIKSKPFLLLAGISGTGKSRIVRELARACWEEGTEEYKAHKPKNFEMVQIKPNWHDSSELIGYVSRVSGKPEFIAGDFLKFVAKAWENLDVPHFLCLDEMNLAPVEQYFAEYLSVVESRKCTEDGTIMTDSILKPEYKIDNDTGEKIYAEWYDNLVKVLLRDCPIEKLHALTTQFKEDGISIPQNLIVVGTVNMDETTFSFSRQVLDRAMTIEMNEVDLKGGLENRHEQIGKLSKAELIGMAVEGVDVYKSKEEVCDKVITYLQKINDKLEGTPFKVAYRTRNEFLLYVVNNLPYKQEGKSEDFVIQRALDEITCMKVLSRIEGDETKVSRTFLNSLEELIKTYLPEILENDSVSLKKITEMKKRLESGYTSFWS